MKNKITIGRFGLIIAFLSVLFSFGLFSQAGAQVMASPISVPCTALGYNLGYGAEDSSVTSLQMFLEIRGYLQHVPTGYFGSLTYTAVQNFQANNGIPATGFVGPLTRAAIQSQSCGSQPTPGTIGVSLQSINPTAGSVGTTVTLIGSGFTANGNRVNFGSGAIANLPAEMFVCSAPVPASPGMSPCYNGSDNGEIQFTVPSSIGPYCAAGMACPMYMQLVTPGTYPVSVTNQNGTSNTVNFTVTGGGGGTIGGPLSISGIDAPNALVLGSTGTWTVHAIENGTTDLHYSVLWGDEAAVGSGGFAIPQSSPIASSATFTHTYLHAGMYTPQFTVTDDFGNSATAKATVTISPLY